MACSLTFSQYFLGSSMDQILRHPRPTSQKQTQEPPAKRTRAALYAPAQPNDDTLDLVYPFWHPNNSATGGRGGEKGGTHVTVASNGPLHLAEGTLSAKLKIPITLIDQGIGLSYHSDTLETHTDTQELTVKAAAPISTGHGNGLTLEYDPDTLEVVDGKLRAKTDTEGAISSSTGRGLVLNIDTNTFLIEEKKLKLQPSIFPSYLSPYATFELQPVDGLSTYSAQVHTDRKDEGINPIWNVGYYVYLVSHGGMVHGQLNLRLPKSHVPQHSGSSLNEGLSFTFVLSFMGLKEPQSNLSTLVDPITSPKGSNQVFVPYHKQHTGCYLSLPPYSESQQKAWYVTPETNGMKLQHFIPIGVGNCQFGTSVCGTCPATIEVEGEMPATVMVFTFHLKQMSGIDWFKADNTTTTMTTGPISFSYQGYPYLPK
ncbi:fiber protein [Aviadenovirus bubonis]|nr:fiber protein [Owl adenovirus]